MTNWVSLAHEGEIHEDPFKTVPAETRDCMKKIFGDSRFEEMTKGSAFSPEEQKLLESSGCFSQTAKVGEIQVEPVKENPFGGFAEETRSCIVEIIGQEGYDKLARGGSFEEYKHALENSGCFNKQTTIGGEKIAPVKANPFENLHESMQACLKEAIGETRFNELKNGAGFSDNDQKTVEKAGCFKRQHEGKYEGQAGGGPALEVEDCLKNALGEERFNQMKQGHEPPTPGERQKIEELGCFKQDKNFRPIETEVGQGVDEKMEKCMRLALGADTFEKMKKGEITFTEEHRAAGYKCMGQPDHELAEAAPPPEATMPASLKECLMKAVGDERFQVIKGGEEPTNEERAKGEECFRNHERSNKSKTIKTDQIVPPPAEQVPFIKEDPQSVGIKDVQATEGEVVVSGEMAGAKEGTVVDVYIYSDPVQATATVGKDGKTWTLNYDGQLPEGEHKIYAVVKRGSENVRSAVEKYVVGVAQAQALTKNISSQTSAQTTTPITQPTRRVLDYVVYLIGGVLIVALTGLLIYLEIKKRSSEPPGGSNWNFH